MMRTCSKLATHTHTHTHTHGADPEVASENVDGVVAAHARGVLAGHNRAAEAAVLLLGEIAVGQLAALDPERPSARQRDPPPVQLILLRGALCSTRAGLGRIACRFWGDCDFGCTFLQAVDPKNGLGGRVIVCRSRCGREREGA
jgi:hypothetical protein